MTSVADRTAMCERLDRSTDPPSPCVQTNGEHPGVVHRDPRHKLYEGPILPGYRDGEAFRAILAVLPDTPETRIAVHHLVEALRTADQKATRAEIARDRGIREAQMRAEGCATHGPQIRELSHLAHWLDAAEDRAERARLVYLSGLLQVEDFMRGSDEIPPATKGKILKFCERVHNAAMRARDKHTAPTFADCQKAEKCEHPTPDHTRCDQVRGAVRDAAADLPQRVETLHQAFKEAVYELRSVPRDEADLRRLHNLDMVSGEMARVAWETARTASTLLALIDNLDPRPDGS